MTSITRTVNLLGGVASVGALRSRGLSPGLIRGAVRSGLLLQVRKGWVATSVATPEVLTAVALGGRLGCVSAARHVGLWTLEPDARLHVAIPRHSGHAAAHRDPNVIAHWQSRSWAEHDTPIESLDRIVVQMACCLPTELAIATIDSALNQRRIDLSTVDALLNTEVHRGDLVEMLDPRSQSGLESLCRVRLLRLGLPVRSQVHIPGVGAVDLLVGDRLVIEADGREWHSSIENFENDRRRDLRLASLGYRVIRLSYAQIVDGWRLVELAITELVARGEHLWRA